jgi:uncharacterized protein (DUF433 family)
VEPVIKIDPDILGGTPCFAGTRVPIRYLFDYLMRGYSIDGFLEQFPSVQREQAQGLLAYVAQQTLASTPGSVVSASA